MDRERGEGKERLLEHKVPSLPSSSLTLHTTRFIHTHTLSLAWHKVPLLTIVITSPVPALTSEQPSRASSLCIPSASSSPSSSSIWSSAPTPKPSPAFSGFSLSSAVGVGNLTFDSLATRASISTPSAVLFSPSNSSFPSPGLSPALPPAPRSSVMGVMSPISAAAEGKRVAEIVALQPIGELEIPARLRKGKGFAEGELEEDEEEDENEEEEDDDAEHKASAASFDAIVNRMSSASNRLTLDRVKSAPSPSTSSASSSSGPRSPGWPVPPPLNMMASSSDLNRGSGSNIGSSSFECEASPAERRRARRASLNSSRSPINSPTLVQFGSGGVGGNVRRKNSISSKRSTKTPTSPLSPLRAKLSPKLSLPTDGSLAPLPSATATAVDTSFPIAQEKENEKGKERKTSVSKKDSRPSSRQSVRRTSETGVGEEKQSSSAASAASSSSSSFSPPGSPLPASTYRRPSHSLSSLRSPEEYWSFSRSTTKTRLGFNKTCLVWRFVWDNIPHEVELFHSTVGGKRVIRVDSEQILAEKSVFDSGSKHYFTVGRGAPVVSSTSSFASKVSPTILNEKELERKEKQVRKRSLGAIASGAGGEMLGGDFGKEKEKQNTDRSVEVCVLILCDGGVFAYECYVDRILFDEAKRVWLGDYKSRT